MTTEEKLAVTRSRDKYAGKVPLPIDAITLVGFATMSARDSPGRSGFAGTLLPCHRNIPRSESPLYHLGDTKYFRDESKRRMTCMLAIKWGCHLCTYLRCEVRKAISGDEEARGKPEED